MDSPTDKPDTSLAGVALDVVAFGVGLGVAWYLHWQTGDLIWSLWLSSLVVGYAMIVNTIFGPIVRAGWAVRKSGPAAGALAVTAVGSVAGLALLAFFTFHFGLFHVVHSVFLNSFFPIVTGHSFPSLAGYREIFVRYWYFIPAAALAERQAFRPRPSVVPGIASSSGVDSTRPGIAGTENMDMMRPYRNVIRMHLLIFFFVGAHILKLDNFIVYAVVYAVYFFPWRLLGAHWKSTVPSA